MTSTPSKDQDLKSGRDEDRDPEVRSAFQSSVDDGTVRLRRSWPALLATGAVGGIDLSLGVLGLLIVQDATGSHMLGALAFTIGFIALTLARSELFTENFLVPVTAIVAGNASMGALARLWFGTGAMNLVGGFVVMWLTMSALPNLRTVAVEVGRFYPNLGITWEAFSLGILGGMTITVMTWMERNSSSELPKVIAAMAASFLLAAGPLNHVIVSSVEMFGALHAGAPFGYLDWAGATLWAMIANMLGGMLLVTVLRLVQVGRHDIESERRRPPNGASRPPERAESSDG